MENLKDLSENNIDSIIDSSVDLLGQEDTDTYRELIKESSEDEQQNVIKAWIEELINTKEYNDQMVQAEAYQQAYNQTNSEYERSMGRIALLVTGEKDSDSMRKIELDNSKIGWLNGAETTSLNAELCEYHDQKFWVANLTSQQNATKDAFEKLESQGLAEKLMDSIKGATGAAFIEDLRKGAGTLRPMSKGAGPNKRDKKIDTEYPCYKIGVQGSNNRALLILPEKIDGQQVLVVAALFDHEDDQKVYNALNA